MKKITFLMLFLSTLWGHSQVKNYVFSSTPGTYVELSGTTTSLGNTTTNDQYFVDPSVLVGGTTATGPGFDIGFSFVFNGITYDKFGVQANGWIALGSSAYTPAVNMANSGNNLDSPLNATKVISPLALAARIAPLGTNMQAQTLGGDASIQFQLGGTTPNRVMVIQWKNYKRGTSSGDHVNFQVVLHETTNAVDFVYGSFTAATSTSPQVGMMADPVAGAFSTNFANRGNGTPAGWSNTINGTNVNNVVTLQSGTIPVSGLTFTWTPPTCPDPKTLVTSAITTTGATLSWSYASSPTPSSSDYICSTSSTLPTGTGTSTSTASANVSSLTPGTKYNVFVRPGCGTQWVNIGTFRTKCLDMTTYTENFDSYTAGTSSMPDCWATTGNDLCYIDSKGAAPGTAPNALYMNGGGSLINPTASYAILPSVSNLNLGTYRLKFKAYATSTDRTFDVGYFTDINDPSTFTLLQTINLPSPAANAQEFIVVPPATIPAGVKNLVFRNAGTGTSAGGTALYIDDVIWELNPGCSDLKNVLVKSPTTSSVNLSWNVTGTETAWQYIIAPSTVTDPDTLPTTSIINLDINAVTAVGTSRALTVNNLVPNISYKIWVRSKCSGTAFGFWSGSSVFAIPCSPVATIAEDFDGSTTLPACWNKLTSTGTISIAPSMGTASSNALKFTFQDVGANNGAWLGLPPVSTSASGYRLRFKYRGNSTFFTFQIVNLQDPLNIVAGPPSNFTVLANPIFAAKDVEYVFNATVSGASPYLALRIYSGSIYADTVYIDDLVWEPIPTCADVKTFAVNGMTGGSVNLGWTKGATEGDWQYALGTATTTNPGTLTAMDFAVPFIDGVNVTGSIDNLTPSTSYKVWIRSKCSGTSFGAWMGPVYFKTTCSAVEDFAQNFDSSTDFPSCWSKVGTVNASIVNQTGVSSPNILKIEGNTNANQQGIVAMQPVSNSADGTHVLRFRLSGSAVGANVEVGYITNVADPTKFISLNKIFTVASTTTFSSESVELGYDPASQVLAFRNPGTSTTTNTVYIDDVVWEALPTCPDVSNVTFTGITSTTVVVSWNKGGTEGSWQYALTATAESDPKKLTAVNIVNPTINDSSVGTVISGLTPSTSYKVWVRSKCSSSILGSWKGAFAFTTTCAPTNAKITEQFDLNTNLPACWTKVGSPGTVAVAPASGASAPNALTLVSSTTAKAVVALPPVTNAADGTYRLRFKFKTSVANTNIQIGYVTNITDPNSFVLTESFAASASNVYYSKSVNLGTNPTSELLAFKNPNASTITIDDVYWEPLPTCPDVSVPLATKVTSNSVELAWTSGGTETAWQYAVGSSTDQNPDLLTGVDFVTPVVNTSNVVGTINNLTPSTSYNVWVRSKCSGSVGAWMGLYAFSTTCAPTSTTISEKFDSNTNLPACWTKVGSGSVAVVQSDIIGASSSPNALKLDSTTAKAIIALPPVTNSAAGTYTLRFKFRSSVANTNVQVGYLTNITDPSSFTLLQSFVAAAKDTYYVRAVAPGNAPTSQLLAFKNPDASVVYIDDVSWEPIPSCPDISVVSPLKSSSNSIDLGWKVGGSETAWQYAIGASTNETPDSLTPVDFVAPTVTGSDVVGKINNLTPSTSYRVWVRSKCSDTSFGVWSDKASFATNCPPVTSFVQNFDAADLPSCWANKGGSNANITVNTLYMSYSNGFGQPVVAMTPVSNAATGTYRLRFQFKVGISNGAVEVGYLKVLSDPNSFVPLKSFTKVETAIFETVTAQWNDPQVTEVLAFRTASPSIIIDEVNWEPIPGCADIKALAAKSVTGNTATLTWTAGGAETNWQYAKGSATDTDPTTLNAVDVFGVSAATLNNLSPLTTYKVWVRSKCDNGSVGVWGQPLTFTTPCVAVAEVVENFESTYAGYMPSCWTKVGTKGTVSVSNSPFSALHLSLFNYDGTSVAVAALPPVTNLLDGNLNLSFKFAAEIKAASLDVGYVKDITDPTSFVSIATVKTTAANIYESQTVKIPTLPAEAQLLAFRNTAISTFVYIDDVSVSKATLGTESFDEVNFAYYPNPVKDVLNLTLEQAITNVSVFNLLGQQLINQSANGNQVKMDMSNLSAGAYLVKVTAGNQSKTIKVVKE